MSDNLFRQYYVRLRREAIFKSLLWGAAIGFLAAFAAALVTWLTYFSARFFVTVGVFAVVMAAATLICYFCFFRPTSKDVARKVDALGLEERMITMLELEQSDDYIAMLQREDANRSLAKMGMSKFKFTLSLTLIVLLCVGGVCGLSMTTVTGLSDLGIVPSGAQLIDEAQGRNPANFIEVSYSATEGGYIYGEQAQTIRKGEGTGLVIAVANDGYRFYRWTDGYPYPARSDAGITEDMTYTAWFVAVDDDAALSDPLGDAATDQPPEDGNDSEGSSSDQGSTMEVPNYDYVIDWTIEYGDILSDYYASVMAALAAGDIPADLAAFIEAYFSTIS